LEPHVPGVHIPVRPLRALPKENTVWNWEQKLCEASSALEGDIFTCQSTGPVFSTCHFTLLDVSGDDGNQKGKVKGIALVPLAVNPGWATSGKVLLAVWAGLPRWAGHSAKGNRALCTHC